MAKKKEEKLEEALGFDLDVDNTVESPIDLKIQQDIERRKSLKSKDRHTEDGLINCLRNKKVIVRHVPKVTGLVSNPKHIYYGGMAENAIRNYTVPQLQSGKLVNVLTNSEKDFLESVMGLEVNALSIYKKEDNYWENYRIRLTKQDTILDLSYPEDFIKYKVLLANTNFVAKNVETLQDRPKVTYEFVLVEEGEEISREQQDMSYTMRAYMKFGEYKEDKDTLKTVYELIDGRPLSHNSKLVFIQTKINEIIKRDPKMFLTVIEDELLSYKVLIKKAIQYNLIVNRGNYLYLKENGEPLCENNEEPTLSIASRYISLPKNQELKFSLEAKIENLKKTI